MKRHGSLTLRQLGTLNAIRRSGLVKGRGTPGWSAPDGRMADWRHHYSGQVVRYLVELGLARFDGPDRVVAT